MEMAGIVGEGGSFDLFESDAVRKKSLRSVRERGSLGMKEI